MSAVLKQLGTNGATAVGHSFGADVVLAMGQTTRSASHWTERR